jgi:RNA polymerase sigma-70 factor (ECF subfamily)
MNPGDSFSGLPERLLVGDEEAEARVFRRFVHRLVGLACGQFRRGEVPGADPEGVVQSAFGSFFRRLRRGELEFDGWRGIWGLLSVITLRKCGRRREYLRARRRSAETAADGRDLCRELAGREPTPLEAATLADLVRLLFARLGPTERDVVALTLEGYTVREVAERLGRSERSVWRIRECVRSRLRRLIDGDE